MMYQIDSQKRYQIVGYKWKNIELIAVDRGFVAFKDEDGKEHIFIGKELHLEEM